MLKRKFIAPFEIVISLFFIFPIFLAAPYAEAAANPDLKYFEGKVVTIIVSTKPGGGYDAYGRMTARYLQKHLPGSTVIVKNVPGAGHIIGANDVYLSKPNGLTIGVGNYKGLIFAQLAGRPGTKFDLAKYSWLANVSSEPQVMIMGKNTPYKSIKDLQNSSRPVRMGASGVGSSSYNYSLMVGNVLGINIKMIPGFSGSESDMAMMRGELDGQIGSVDNLRPMVEHEGSRPLLLIGKKKSEFLPDVPLIDKYKTRENRGLIDLMVATAELGRPIAAPPGMSPGRLKTLREAIEATFEDPELLAYARKMKLPIDFTSGEDTQKLFVDSLNQSPEVIKLVKELVTGGN